MTTNEELRAQVEALARERAMRELGELEKEFDARAFHVGGPQERAFMECRDACRSRLEEIAKEGL